MTRFESSFSGRSSSGTTRVASQHMAGHEKVEPGSKHREVVSTPDPELINKVPMAPTPRVSWVLAIVFLVIVTIVCGLVPIIV